MLASRIAGQLSQLPAEFCALIPLSRPACSISTRLLSTSHLPRVAQPSLWRSMIPKFLRDRNRQSQTEGDAQLKQPKGSTAFIVLGILVGSQSIHLINLKKDMVKMSQMADARIAQLREVIRRVQAGEDVDVEKILGTNDPKSEKEWEQVMKEIESDDHIWAEKKWKVKRRLRSEASAAGKASNESSASKSGVQTEEQTNMTSSQSREGKPQYY